MTKKGRVKVGADADLTVFDAGKIIDRATYERGDLPSEGIVHVLVEGTFVVRDGKFVEGAFPGRAIRSGR
jgi:N-acyl-D-aspartate/D-glutamate deacylase